MQSSLIFYQSICFFHQLMLYYFSNFRGILPIYNREEPIMSERNLTLLTDLYELTMMQGYFKEKDANETVIFDAFFRANPSNAGYSVCAGLEQVI